MSDKLVKGTRLSSRISMLVIGCIIMAVLLVLYCLTTKDEPRQSKKDVPVVSIKKGDDLFAELKGVPDIVPSAANRQNISQTTNTDGSNIPAPSSGIISNDSDYMKQLELKMAQIKLQALQEAMASSLTVPGASTLIPKDSSANSSSASIKASKISDVNAGILNSDYQAVNMQSDKEQFASSAGRVSDIYLNQTTTPKKYALEIKAGTIIPAILQTGINSDLPGEIIAKVRRNVFDSVNGKDVLIPQGSTLIGVYSSKVSYGQSRCLMVWSRVIYPDGENLNLEGMEGADMEGYAGIEDEVNNHYWKVFGNAILMSVFAAGVEYATQGFSNNNNSNSNAYNASQIIAGALGLQMGEAGMAMVQKNMNIQPTIEIRPGNEFNVLVTRDIAFRKPYTYKL